MARFGDGAEPSCWGLWLLHPHTHPLEVVQGGTTPLCPFAGFPLISSTAGSFFVFQGQVTVGPPQEAPRVVMRANPHSDGVQVLRETGEEQLEGEREGRWQELAPEWGWQPVFPVGRGQAQGTGFLVNSVQPALKIPLLWTGHAELLGPPPEPSWGPCPFPERSRGWEESPLEKSRISSAKKVEQDFLPLQSRRRALRGF